MSNTELKKVKGRVQNKHKTEAEWLLDVYPNGDRTQNARTDAFIPLAGELIIYDPDTLGNDYYRFKFGDNSHNVDELPFVNEEFREQLDLLQVQKANGVNVNISGPGYYLQTLYDLINTKIGSPMGRTVIVSTTGYTQSFGLIRFSFAGGSGTGKKVFFLNLLTFRSKEYTIDDLSTVTYSSFVSNETTYPNQNIYATKEEIPQFSDIAAIDLWADDQFYDVVAYDNGIEWGGSYVLYNENEDKELSRGRLTQKIPLTEGPYVKFNSNEAGTLLTIDVPIIGDIQSALTAINAQTEAIIGGN